MSAFPRIARGLWLFRGALFRDALFGVFGLIALALLWAAPAFAQDWQVREISWETVPTVTLRSGSIPTTEGLQLNLTADRGSVTVFTDANNEVRYIVRAEAEPGASAAALAKEFSLRTRKGPKGVSLDGSLPTSGDAEHLWLDYEIHVPRRYGVVISSKAGDIVTEDVEGPLTLATGGGNIHAGRVVDAGGRGAFAASLETGGGNIVVGDVSGSLRAVTAGGHISAGDVGGDAVIRTAGGHIEIGQVRGNEQLSTGGGNIAAVRGDDAAVETAGGRIEFGEASGAIHARTNGGGVRIAHIGAPTEVDSENGALYVAGIEAPLRASAKDGAITAWFSPRFGRASAGSSAAAPTELASGRGDIVVYLPRGMAVNIDAVVDQGSGHRIIADRALPLKAMAEDATTGDSSGDSNSAHALHVQATMNGGGSVLHVRTADGDIHIRLLDTDSARWSAGLGDMIARQDRLQREMMRDMEQQVDAIMDGSAVVTPESRMEAQAQIHNPDPDASAIPGGLAGIARLFEGIWHGGGVWVNPDEQQKRLVQAVRPAYPEAAREAGLEGDVTLQVEIGPDGSVKDIRAFAGDPELARAASNAVAQWRYAPALLDGRPMSVVTTVTLAFRLR